MLSFVQYRHCPLCSTGTAARLVAAASPCLLANLVDLTAGVVPVTRVRGDEQSGRAFSFDRVLRTAIQTDIDSIGLPVGVQVIGLNGEPAERTVLDLMAAIESRGGISVGGLTNKVNDCFKERVVLKNYFS